MKAETYCSAMERCVVDVEAKLSQWGATPEMMEKIVRHLQDERYIDQKRFCSAFVRDKYRFNQWGRVKICQALRMKKIPACTEYERNGKLIRFAVGRGFEMEAVCRCVKQTGEDDVYLD